ncbi:hypothetical protein JZU54_04065 [bacterium]|nr:hypothetical protein [bacterium]
MSQPRPFGASMADVLSTLAASSMPETRKALLTNAVGAICRWLAVAPSDLAADRTVTTPLLKKLVAYPARTGTSKGHVKNMKAFFEQALDVLSPRERLPMIANDDTGLSPLWRELWVA